MCYVPFRDLGRREVELTKNGSMLSRRTRPLRTTVRCPAIWEVEAETLLFMSSTMMNVIIERDHDDHDDDSDDVVTCLGV